MDALKELAGLGGDEYEDADTGGDDGESSEDDDEEKKKIAEWGKKRRAEEKKAAQKHSAKFTAAGQPGLQAALAARLPQTATPAQLLILLGMALLLAALLLRRWVLARC